MLLSGKLADQITDKLPSIQDEISSPLQLAEQITNKLRIIQDEISSQLLKNEDWLKRYPIPLTQNIFRIIFNLALRFSQEVRTKLEGEFPYEAWRNNKKLSRS
jgi:hypothetical protein